MYFLFCKLATAHNTVLHLKLIQLGKPLSLSKKTEFSEFEDHRGRT